MPITHPIPFLGRGEENVGATVVGVVDALQRTMTVEVEEKEFFDITGKGTTLFHHSAGADETSLGSQHVRQSQTWFDSGWSGIAFERTSA
ncbi:hypothetical protein [Streptomyces sp. B6B3]|uniref:hypothetical protein n=1 Tax=Streptomyces sp. B6B3 TaxID=3153570 RepID=UPI00325D3371